MATTEKPTVVTIVDDDDNVRSAVQGPTKEAGFTTLAFASAEEFLHSGEQQRTSCLIADIRMPGMSGLELQSKLNAECYRFPIIFITAVRKPIRPYSMECFTGKEGSGLRLR